MTKILSPLVVGYLNNSNHAQLHERFGFRSDVLKKHGLKDEIWAEAGFVFDFESIPNLIRGPIGENKRGGAGHDILSRKNICPGITKSIAADVYFEIMEYCDSIDTQRFAKHKYPYLPTSVIVPYVKTRGWARRWLKSTVVRFWPGDFWQKYEMTATPSEIYGVDGDPYVTVEEKMDALIEKTEAVSAGIKEVAKESPGAIEKPPEMIEKIDMITEDLKDDKQKIVDKLFQR